MSHTPFAIWCAVLTVLLVGVAAFTDLRWRRIPNILTFTAFSLAVVSRLALQGLPGFGFALLGALIAPIILVLLHGGRGLGMGDLKLAAAIGAIVGPMLAVVTMLITAIAGGILAIVMMMRPGGQLHTMIRILSIGIPFLGHSEKGTYKTPARNSVATMPYGVAIGVGSILTLALCWWTGSDSWFLSFFGIGTPL